MVQSSPVKVSSKPTAFLCWIIIVIILLLIIFFQMFRNNNALSRVPKNIRPDIKPPRGDPMTIEINRDDDFELDYEKADVGFQDKTRDDEGYVMANMNYNENSQFDKAEQIDGFDSSGSNGY